MDSRKDVYILSHKVLKIAALRAHGLVCSELAKLFYCSVCPIQFLVYIAVHGCVKAGCCGRYKWRVLEATLCHMDTPLCVPASDSTQCTSIRYAFMYTRFVVYFICAPKTNSKLWAHAWGTHFGMYGTLAAASIYACHCASVSNSTLVPF